MDSHIIIREYCPTDRNDVMNLIRLNIPKYFAVKEEADLGRYLDEEVELYYVLLFDGMIVGCGGINFADNMMTGKISCIIRKTKCFDFWERNVLFPKTKRSFFRTPTLPFSA